ncbi:MAG: mechanosensitive ion channel [Phycisphaerales bacterium]|nr:mechanosensitive ion channel [Phycisphaerales bacterium]
MRTLRSAPVVTLLIAVLCVTSTLGDSPAPQTNADPAIPIEDLRLLLKPLTKAELAVEADAWRDLLKAKVAEISVAEIALRQANREARATRDRPADTQPASTDETAIGTLPTAETQPAAETRAEERRNLLDEITKLREQRVGLLDRLKAVLAEFELKGGDTADYEKYAAAVSGITVDLTDTTATWTAIVGWLRSPQGGIRWAFNILWFFVTLIVFWILAGIASRATHRAFAFGKNISDLLRTFSVNLVRRVVLLAGLLVALTMLEVKITPVLAIIGGAAFVIGFALQGTLSNFASGLLILAYRPFELGDVVKAGGVFGTVESMTLLSTYIKTADNQRVIVANNAIWNDVITNVTGLPTRRVDLVFSISYSDDIDKATTVLEGIVATHPLVLKDPAPVVKLHELGESSVNFVCRPWARTSDYWTVYWDVTRSVKQRFDAAGISIPFPQRDVHVYTRGAAPAS